MDTSLVLICRCHDAENKHEQLCKTFATVGIEALAIGGAAHARALFFDRVDDELLQTLRALKAHSPGRVLAIAADESLLRDRDAWRLMRSGAAEIVSWSAEEGLLQRIAQRLQRWTQVDRLVGSEVVQRHAIGKSAIWLECLRRVVETARYADGPMLLTGESGTGKELIARLVHALDPRPDKGELVVLDCTTVVPTLSGSEFFGHERGAFTGAAGVREGAFSLADRGTLFLDEVGELPLALQAQLLRVVQEKTYKRVGGNQWHSTNFRLLCATHRDLEAQVERGEFRADFFHRITRSRCHLPSLRERGDDVLALFQHFFAELRPDHPQAELDAVVKQFLLQRAYPGNVRELRHLVSRISDRHVGIGPVSVGDIPAEDLPDIADGARWPDEGVHAVVARALALGVGLKELARGVSEVAIRQALDSEGGNLQRAAKRLKVTDRALQMRKAQGAA